MKVRLLAATNAFLALGMFLLCELNAQGADAPPVATGGQSAIMPAQVGRQNISRAQSTSLLDGRLTAAEAKGDRILSASSLSLLPNVLVQPGTNLTIVFDKATSLLAPQTAITNFGNIVGVAPLRNRALIMNVAAIMNAKGASISFADVRDVVIVSPFLWNGGTISAPDSLSLKVADQFVNTGSISAGSALSLTVGKDFRNAGTIASTAGSVHIYTGGLDTTTLMNSSGSIYAATSINLITHQISPVTIIGGILNAKEINVMAPAAEVNAQLESINGTVNVKAASAHIGVSTGTLDLGRIDTSGDPTFFNDAGGIAITGNISVGERLAILASADITATANVSLIQARSAAGRGFDIRIIAGADMTGTGATTGIGATPPVTGNVGSAVTLSGLPSATGGNIDFSTSPNLRIDAGSSCFGCSGANVLLAAFANGGSGGQVHLKAPSLLGTGTTVSVGARGGNNGTISIIAGATSSEAVRSGTLLATAGSGMKNGTGIVSIFGAQPTSSNGQPIVFAADGSITSNNSLVPAGVATAGSILLNGDVAAKNGIVISAGGNILSGTNVVSVVQNGTGNSFPAPSPDGKRVYVPSPSTGELLVLNAVTNTPIARIATGGLLPTYVTVSPDGSRAYVSNSGSDTISVINTASNKVIATISGVTGVAGLAIDASGKTLYAAESSINKLAVIDTRSRVVSNSVAVGIAPRYVSVNNSSGYVYVGDTASNEISVYDPAKGVSVQHPVSYSPAGFGPCPCGTKIFVADPAGDKVHVFSAETNTDLLGIPVGSSPVAVGINPTGSTAYVANSASANVSIIGTLSNTVHQTVSLAPGSAPSGVAASFVGNNPVAYVADSTGSLHVLKTAALVGPRIDLDTVGGDIFVATGPTSVHATASGGAFVTSPGTLVSRGGTAGAGYQLASPTKLIINAPITADVIDFHAIAGSLTNNSTMTANGALFFIASPSVVNNGVMKAGSGVGPTTLALQAPSGRLSVAVGARGKLIADSPSGLLALNPAGGTSVLVRGLGSAEALGGVKVFGDDGESVNISLQQIKGVLSVIPRASVVNVRTTISDLAIGDVRTDNGGLSVNAAGGTLRTTGNLTSDGTVSLSAAGSILSDATIAARTVSLKSAAPCCGQISISGGIVSTGGSVNVTAPAGVTIAASVKSATDILIRASKGDVDVGSNLTSTAGGITAVAGGSQLRVHDAVITASSAIKARPARIFLSNSNATNGSILIDSNSTIQTVGPGASSVKVTIGAPPLAPRVGPIPAAIFSPTPSNRGPFYFGVNGIDVANEPNVFLTSVNDQRIVFSTGRLGSSAIQINATSGPVQFLANPTAAPINALQSESANADYILDTDEI